MSWGSPALSRITLGLARLIVGAAIFVSIGINFANIVGRYVFGSPILWAEEVLDYLMVWYVFLGAILVTWEGRHIKMDLLSVMIPPPFRQICNSVAAAVFLAVCGFMIWESWSVVRVAWQLYQRSVAADLPMAFAHAGVLLGFCGMALALLFRFRSYVATAFGSETEAVQKQVTDTFGTFD